MKAELYNQLIDSIDADREKVVDICYQLVARNSENPPGDTTAIARYASELLKRHGLDHEIVAPQPTMPNIVATIQGRAAGPHLVFNGHMDTFPIGRREGWSVNPLGEVRDGRIYGRGAADMKGGVTASIIAFLRLAETRDEWSGRATLTLVSDEETGAYWGTRHLLKHYPDLRGDAVLNGEPSSPRIAFFGEKGSRWLHFRARTDGGHGAYAHDRPSANEILMRALLELKEIEKQPVTIPEEARQAIIAAREHYDAARDAGATEAVMAISCNFGKISGGTSINMIAEYCEAAVCIRLPPGVPMRIVDDHVERVLARYPQISVETEKSIEATASAVDNPILERVLAAGERVMQDRVFPAVSLGGTDIRFWRTLGTHSAVYGPTHHNMGSPDEYIKIEDLIAAAKVHAASSYDYLASFEGSNQQYASDRA